MKTHSVLMLLAIAASAAMAEAQSPGSCADLTGLTLERVEITKAEKWFRLVSRILRLIRAHHPSGLFPLTAAWTVLSIGARASVARSSALALPWLCPTRPHGMATS